MIQSTNTEFTRDTKAISSTSAFLLSVVSKLLIVGLNAGTGILSARALEPTGRGELAAMTLWYVFLASAFTFGIPSALTYQMRKHPERASEILSAAMMLALIASVTAAALGFVELPRWLQQYDPQVIFFSRLFLLNTPVSALFLVGRAALESDNNFAGSNLSLVGPPSITLVVLIGLWATHRLTPVAAAWAYVPAGLPFFFLMWMQLSKRFTLCIRSFLTNSKLLLSYGLRSYGIDLCGTMALYVDQALVVRMLRPEMMGTYVVALSLSRMLNVFHTAVIMVLFPKAVSAHQDDVLAMTGRAARMTTLLTSAAGVCVAVLGPILLGLLYGAQYRSASGLLRILVVEVVLSGATLVLSQAFMALSRPGIVTLLQVIGLGLTIPLMLWLVPKYGTAGAAIALLLSTCARFVFVCCSFRLFLGRKLPAFIPSSDDVALLYSFAKSKLGLSAVGVGA